MPVSVTENDAVPTPNTVLEKTTVNWSLLALFGLLPTGLSDVTAGAVASTSTAKPEDGDDVTPFWVAVAVSV